MITLYTRDREKLTTGPRQEALYRLGSEHIVQDENVYRMEYVFCFNQFIGEKVFTIQLIGKEDQVTDESITSEEKWSLYVDQFVQLSTTENLDLKRREPFCKRNLPSHVGEEPPLNVETRSGLELKICVNTYKIFFVDNTEDYFRRKKLPSPSSSLGLSQTEKTISVNDNRSQRFRNWLESEKGWKSGLDEKQVSEMNAAFDNWVKPGKIQ